jgi:fructan beta-fructosidase
MNMKMKKLLNSLALLLTAIAISCNTGNGPADATSAAESTDQTSLNNELHRPQFHFTPPSKWMNDPNGMVYHNGEYHLFYQHNPDTTVWAPMHWGHAVSKDLVHWEHLPIALYPDSLGMIFSGSAVVDHANTAGFGATGNPAMVAIYTYHDMDGEKAGRQDYQSQGIAYSLDNGRTWTTYQNNPVLKSPGIRDFRDPKVFWYEEGKKWVMSLAVADKISFYSSPDLKDWQLESHFGQNIGGHGGVWECPDLFKLPVEGTNQEKWVLLVSINPGGPNGGSATQYFVGDFDGNKFVLDPQFQQNLSQKNPVPAGKVLADFEGRNYNAWTSAGEAFGTAPAAGSIGNQQKVSGFTGRGLVNSFRNGDAATGTLTSPDFTLDADYLNLQVGGGKHPGGTAVNLLVGGERVRSTTGNNSEALNWVAWDITELKGQKGRIEIVDNVQGGWGHILVDQIMLAAEPAKANKDGIWIDYGRDNYAGVTFANIPKEDGRRIFMGWMSNWDYANVVPTATWRSAMTLPRTLTLQNTSAGLRLVSRPVKEMEQLIVSSHALPAQTVSEAVDLSSKLPAAIATFYLSLELEAQNTEADFVIELSNTKNQKMLIGFDPKQQQYFSDRTLAGTNDFSENFASVNYGPRLATGSTFSLQLWVDEASVELFADGGQTVMTDIFFPEEPFTQVRLVSTNGKVRLKSGEISKLKSIRNPTF